MKFQFYSIYDRVIGEYGVPFIARNDADAKRRVAAGYANNPIAGDLALYFVGFFNSDGSSPEEVIVGTAAEFICNVSDLFEVKSDE